MDSEIVRTGHPESLGVFEMSMDELCFYQYFKCKNKGTSRVVLEKRMRPCVAMINECLKDFDDRNPKDSAFGKNVYVTLKHLYQFDRTQYNRRGYHCDGFGTNDMNYIWSNTQPTIFNRYQITMTDCHDQSLVDMRKNLPAEKEYSFHNKSLIMLRPNVPHRVNECGTEGVRTFFKLSITDHEYDLYGNSINHKLITAKNYPKRLRNKWRNPPERIL